LAIGCAAYGWLKVLNHERVCHIGSTFFGGKYEDSTITAALSKYDGLLRVTRANDCVKQVAAMLADGKMVGWFQGGAEFGPRALGHRSILADPRNPGVRDFINSRIKFREDFRLFAPSVLADEANVYFDCDYESPYMILVAPVRDEWRDKIPSVVHRDHSARIQTVTEATDPKYYQLLKAFKELTGIPILLNTSFNKRGMPIVETPEQAIEFFLECDLDIPSISDYIVVKAARKSTGLGFENR
jgi:carbamoyltransferase